MQVSDRPASCYDGVGFSVNETEPWLHLYCPTEPDNQSELSVFVSLPPSSPLTIILRQVAQGLLEKYN